MVEQRYHAVMEVLAAGASKTDVATRYGVSRQSVHEWVRRYQTDGLAGLADRSHRPLRHPAQMSPEVEAAVCELRRVHPRWGFQHAGRRVTLRLDGPVLHLVIDGVLTRTMPCPVPAAERHRIRDARLAGPMPVPPPGPARVQRKVSSRGGIQVCNQRVQVGMTHARKIVTIEIDQALFRILDSTGTVLTVVARANTEEVTRHKAYGTMNRTTG